MAAGNSEIPPAPVVDEMSSEHFYGRLLTDDRQAGNPHGLPSAPHRGGSDADPRPPRRPSPNWRLRTKLALLSAVPLLLSLALGGLAIHEARGHATTLRDAAILGAGLLVAVIALVAIARSIIAPLRELRESALDMAEWQLPTAIHVLRTTEGSVADVRIDPVPLYSDEDVGGIARAFDAVQGQVVQLAADQAALRANINDMFVTLADRSERLVERQLAMIDQLRRGEQDADRLAALIPLDHLTLRMRRGGENLLVLAGTELRHRTGEPMPIVDVLGAAVVEIEDYQRVAMYPVPGAAVSGLVVNDIVHLVAELLDNATAYSNPESQVTVGARLTRDAGLAIEITDTGPGMPSARLTEINNRLVALQAVDVSVLRQMGLFVVGRLANRHGLRVHLSPHDGPGITATVALPSHLISSAEDAAPAVPHDAGTLGQLHSQPAHVPAARPAQLPDAPWEYEPAADPEPQPLGVTMALGPLAAPQSPEPPDAARDHDLPAYTEPVPIASVPAKPGSLGDLAEDATGTLDTPIFQAMLSKWFTERDETGQASQTALAQDGWESEADAGWQIAGAASEPVAYQLTAAGLPRRQPQAFLIPGSVGSAGTVGSSVDASADAPAVRSADAVRGRMSSFQQGLARGRHAPTAGTPDELPAGGGYGRHTRADNTEHEGHIAEGNR
jgi:signal transduction histidine kinase